MKNETVLLLLVVLGGGYFLFFKKANTVQYGALPAPAGANPNAGYSQESTSSIATAALNLISQAFKTFGSSGKDSSTDPNSISQTSAQRF